VVHTPRWWSHALWAFGLVTALLWASLSAPLESVSAQQPARYIILLKEDGTAIQGPSGRTRAEAVAHAVSARPQQVYSRAITGFAAELTPAQVQALRGNPDVAAIVPDLPTQVSTQSVPTGIQRIGTLTNAWAKIDGIDDPMPIDVAVLDTGIDLGHPDLNVVGGYDCTGSGSYRDRHGHGTHVAGIIGARDNSSGVVGVVPGARLWAVKVFSDQGSGYVSWLICGIDWVVERAGTIDVANFSGGAGGTDSPNCGQGVDPLHQAVCRLVNAGVPFVVAAGNDGRDAGNTIPAAYPEVIAVGAIVDTDGKPGGLGPSTSAGADDTRASFSNFGPTVDLYAPGVRILSTYPGGSTALMSGTSMAAPHVAGAAALYRLANPGASPNQVRNWLVTNGESGSWGSQPLVNIGGSTGGTPPPSTTRDVAVTGLSVPGTVTAGTTVTVGVTVRNEGNVSETVEVSLSANGTAVGSTRSITIDAGASRTVSFSWSPTASGTVTLVATASIGDADSDPSDNSRQVTVTVQSGSVRDVSLSRLRVPSSVRQGRSATIYVTLTNRGSVRETVTVTLNSNPSNSAAGSPSLQVTVDPGRSKSVRFTWRTSSQTAVGPYQVTVTAPLAQDQNPADNTVSRTIRVTASSTRTRSTQHSGSTTSGSGDTR